MSTSDNIFVHTDLPVTEAAERVRQALGLRLETDLQGRIFLVRETPGGSVRQLGGQFQENPHRTGDVAPDEMSVIDGYEYDWNIRSVPGGRDVLDAASPAIFRELAAALPWSMILVRQVDTLLAASSPGTGLVEFEPVISPDGDAVDLWRPFDVNR
jgi:hypothetical protein